MQLETDRELAVAMEALGNLPVMRGRCTQPQGHDGGCAIEADAGPFDSLTMCGLGVAVHSFMQQPASEAVLALARALVRLESRVESVEFVVQP